MNCRVRHCTNAPASRGVLCSDHWSLVPERMRQAIWDEFRPGQTMLMAPTFRRLVGKAVRVAESRDRNDRKALDRDNDGVRLR